MEPVGSSSRGTDAIMWGLTIVFAVAATGATTLLVWMHHHRAEGTVGLVVLFAAALAWIGAGSFAYVLVMQRLERAGGYQRLQQRLRDFGFGRGREDGLQRETPLARIRYWKSQTWRVWITLFAAGWVIAGIAALVRALAD